jgi:hypothetical protein
MRATRMFLKRGVSREGEDVKVKDRAVVAGLGQISRGEQMWGKCGGLRGLENCGWERLQRGRETAVGQLGTMLGRMQQWRRLVCKEVKAGGRGRYAGKE